VAGVTPSDPPGQKAAVRDFFNDGAESWQDRYARADFESVSYQDRMGVALGFLARHVRPGAKVLDAGCGAGVQAAAMQALGYRVVACDLAPEMARKASASIRSGTDGGGGRALVADLDCSPFRPGTFDAAMSLGVIGYASDPDALLRSLRAALKPGGVLVISTAGERLLLWRLSNALSWLPDRLYGWVKHTLLRRERTGPGYDLGFYKDHYRYTTAPAFDRFLAAGGFTKLDSTGVNYGRLHFMGLHPWPEALEVALSRLVGLLARRGPLRFLQRYARIYVTCVVRDGS
jgi:2-polyprenyl-3-methyl-5-hydroxy-6-metoxy-1,4-benzoquinol methylase